MPESAGAGSFAAHFARAVESRGVTLSWLRHRLAEAGAPVAMSTLSSWRSGRRSPYGAHSAVVVGHLERLLELREGHLRERMGAHHVRRRVVKASYGGVRDGSEPMDVALDRIQTPDDGSTVVLSQHIVAVVAADGTFTRIDNRQLVLANRDGVDRLPLVYYSPETAGPDRPDEPPGGSRFEVVSGAGAGPRYESDREGCYGLGLLLDPVLRAGDTALVEVAFRPPAAALPTGELEQIFTHGRQEAIVAVSFAPDRLPARVETFVTSEGTPEVSGPAALRDGVALVAVSDFGPGVVGVRWTW